MFGITIKQKYKGFSYAENDASGKTINAKGTIVVNVYYNRRVVTYQFYFWSDGREVLDQWKQRH